MRNEWDDKLVDNQCRFGETCALRDKATTGDEDELTSRTAIPQVFSCAVFLHIPGLLALPYRCMDVFSMNKLFSKS